MSKWWKHPINRRLSPLRVQRYRYFTWGIGTLGEVFTRQPVFPLSNSDTSRGTYLFVKFRAQSVSASVVTEEVYAPCHISKNYMIHSAPRVLRWSSRPSFHGGHWKGDETRVESVSKSNQQILKRLYYVVTLIKEKFFSVLRSYDRDNEWTVIVCIQSLGWLSVSIPNFRF